MNAIVLGTAILLGAPGLKDPPKKDAGIVGEWEMQPAAVAPKGGARPTPDLIYEFTADGQWILRRHGTVLKTVPREFKVDPRAKPATIDVTFSQAAGAVATRNMVGIYKIEGETLTICFSPGGNTERPKSFERKAGVTVLLTLKRVKKK